MESICDLYKSNYPEGLEAPTTFWSIGDFNSSDCFLSAYTFYLRGTSEGLPDFRDIWCLELYLHKEYL